jgi:hypothetical protein
MKRRLPRSSSTTNQNKKQKKNQSEKNFNFFFLSLVALCCVESLKKSRKGELEWRGWPSQSVPWAETLVESREKRKKKGKKKKDVSQKVAFLGVHA